jgi:signal peptidase I
VSQNDACFTIAGMASTLKRRWRLPLAALACLLAGCVLAAWWGYRVYRPYRIVGPSMAETLRGRHGRLDCEECGYRYRFDAEETPIPVRLVCPMCGHVHAGTGQVALVPGDIARIHREAFASGGPQRFDIVAFQVPGDEAKTAVKRAMGLPGERVAIRGGEIYINGALLQKHPFHHSDFATLVHSGDFGPVSRWRDDSVTELWHHISEGTATNVDTGETRRLKSFVGIVPPVHEVLTSFAWLTYQHQPPLDLAAPRTAQPISDFDPYNASLARPVNDVFDLRIECDVLLADPDSRAALRLHDGHAWWELAFNNANGMMTLSRDGEQVAEAKLPSEFGDEHGAPASSTLHFGLLDGEVFAAAGFDATPAIIRQTLPASTAPRVAQTDQIALGIQRGEASFRSVRLLRDIYYLDPVGLAQPWQLAQPLGPDEYLLLGDNPPASTDGSPAHCGRWRGSSPCLAASREWCRCRGAAAARCRSSPGSAPRSTCRRTARDGSSPDRLRRGTGPARP